MFFKKRAKHLVVGERGEKVARREMKRMGLEILHINYSVHNVGEIDIIARDGGCLVFTEVKTRSQKGFSRAGEAVNSDKRRKILLTAKYYSRQIGGEHLRYRFDVVEVYLNSRWTYEINYLANAYNLDHI